MDEQILVQDCGEQVLFFMAAAVSDFYIPWQSLPEHKIQSAGGALSLELANVPKCLGVLRQSWAPRAMFISFKLETDPDLLHCKAAAAIAKYGVHCVVANLLDTRKNECDPASLAHAFGQGRSQQRQACSDYYLSDSLCDSASWTHSSIELI